MGSSKKKDTGFVPPLPPMPAPAWKADSKEQKEQWKEFKSYVETFWDQMEELHRTTMDNWKKQWEKAFPQLMDMEDTFASYLPDEFPALPGMPSPKEFMGKLKEFQEMANKHAVEQTENFMDFVKQGQQQAKTAVKDAVKSIEEKAETAGETADQSSNK